MFEINGKISKAKVFASSVDTECISQIIELCNQEWTKGCQIAIMPDCHPGKGNLVGLTVKLKDKICPALIGKDIGCGMLVVEIPSDLVLNFPKIDQFICQKIAHENKERDNSHWKLYVKQLRCIRKYISDADICEIANSMGTLGNGNHFIEIAEPFEGTRYLIIHSGSRLMGQTVGEFYQAHAIDKNYNPFTDEHVMPSPGVARYLTGELADDYLYDMKICQRFASLNRMIIARRIMEFIAKDNDMDDGYLNVSIEEIIPGQIKLSINNKLIEMETNAFESIHNYIDDDMILRKGAVSAAEGQQVIIPISMKEGSIMGIGKGNSKVNFSGPHGAGRIMSRGEAKERITIEEYQESMRDIYTSSVKPSTISESPMVYKDIKEIIANISDLVDIRDICKPIYNYKSH